MDCKKTFLKASGWKTWDSVQENSFIFFQRGEEEWKEITLPALRFHSLPSRTAPISCASAIYDRPCGPTAGLSAVTMDAFPANVSCRPPEGALPRTLSASSVSSVSPFVRVCRCSQGAGEDDACEPCTPNLTQATAKNLTRRNDLAGGFNYHPCVLST
ncbi:hypothetical protein BaRGS_00023728 [Batillaria attramentaria]|uniref:Uncharacterized protein n=1 Tax=Batillaria attramentaria TaxID=370345 RepID=A0ABD0KCX1_9CAEN